MSLGRIAARGAAATSVGQAFRFALQAGSMVLLARLLDPGSFGLVAMITAITGLALVIADFGLSMAYVQAKSVTEQERSNLFWTNTAIGSILFASLYCSAGWIAEFYQEPRLIGIAHAISFVFLLTSLSAQHRADLSRRMQFGKLALCDAGSAAGGTLVAVLVALKGGGHWALVSQQIAIALINSIVLASLTRWWPAPPRNLSNLKRFIAYGTNTSLVQVLNYITTNIDNLLIGRTWGATSLGYYDRAYQIFKVPLNQIAAPMTRVAVPVLSRVSSNDEFSELLHKGRSALIFTIGLGFLFVSVNAEYVVTLAFGDGWKNSSHILSILAVGGVFQALSYPYFWAFLAKAQTGAQLKFSLISKASTMALIIVAIPYGVTAVAFAVTAGQAINWLILNFAASRRLNLGHQFRFPKIVMPLLWISTPSLASFFVQQYFTRGSSPVLHISVSIAIYISWITATITFSPKFRHTIFGLFMSFYRNKPIRTKVEKRNRKESP